MNETSNAVFRPVPGDGWVPGCFTDNRNKIPWKELEPYAGKYVAFSLDGTRIIANGADRDELYARLKDLGISSAHAVIDYVDPLI